jgi:Tfp pilus assembly protein PilO
MPPIKLSDREKNLIIITIGAVVFYFFYQFLLVPKWDEIGKFKDRARTLRLDLKVSEGKIRILDAIEKSAGVLPEKTEMSREEKALEILKLLSTATVRSGLNISFIKPLLEEAGEGLKFSLSCSGRYQNLYTFFFILYHLRILILIDTLSVVSSSGPAPDLDIKMTLTAFY